MELSFNATALSFGFSAILAGLIAWRAHLAWRKQPANLLSEAFFKIMLWFVLYLGIRAAASLLFPFNTGILAASYVISHVFLGIATAYLAKLSVASFFSRERARMLFLIVLGLFALDVAINLFLPNHPEFHPSANVIEWGTHPVVGIFHTALLWSVFLGAAILFAVKTVQLWGDKILRTRSLFITLGLLSGILIVIPRNIVDSPLVTFISDVGYALSFLLVYFGIQYKSGEDDRNQKLPEGELSES